MLYAIHTQSHSTTTIFLGFRETMELGFKIVKFAPVWAGFGAHRERGLVQNQIIERVVFSDTLSIKWFSYCSKRNSDSYLDSLHLSYT